MNTAFVQIIGPDLEMRFKSYLVNPKKEIEARLHDEVCQRG